MRRGLQTAMANERRRGEAAAANAMVAAAMDIIIICLLVDGWKRGADLMDDGRNINI